MIEFVLMLTTIRVVSPTMMMMMMMMTMMMNDIDFESGNAHSPYHFGHSACAQEFPPSPGSYFRTSILQWSFANNSFWRIPDMATVMDIAKSIAVVGWRDAPRLENGQLGNTWW